MFVCIGPSIMDIEATRDTLRFAQSTGKIKAIVDFIDIKALAKEKNIALASITIGQKFFCKLGIKLASKISYFPNTHFLERNSLADLATLKPKKIHYLYDMERFELEMSTGQKKVGGTQYLLLKEAPLPERIRKIDMYFKRDEQLFHSIEFFGETTLHVGLTKETEVNNRVSVVGLKRGRKETFIAPEGHELLGCIMHHDKDNDWTRAVEWITWRPPRA